MDGVVLCHLANHFHPRSVAGIHVPSPAVVGLTLFILMMKASLIRQFVFFFFLQRLSTNLFPAQARHGQVSAKCGELLGGVQENWGTRGKTTSASCISCFPRCEFLFSFFFSLLSPLIFTTVNVQEYDMCEDDNSSS